MLQDHVMFNVYYADEDSVKRFENRIGKALTQLSFDALDFAGLRVGETGDSSCLT